VQNLLELLRLSPDGQSYQAAMLVAIKTAVAALKHAGPQNCCLSLAGSFGKRRSVAVALVTSLALRRLQLAKPYLWTPSVDGLLACN